jgi:hypothetical protein
MKFCKENFCLEDLDNGIDLILAGSFGQDVLVVADDIIRDNERIIVGWIELLKLFLCKNYLLTLQQANLFMGKLDKKNYWNCAMIINTAVYNYKYNNKESFYNTRI